MNYIGHKGTAVALYPLIVFPIIEHSINTPFLFINTFYNFLSNLMQNYINLNVEYPIILLLSFFSYWIGATFIDFIDFKFLKPLFLKTGKYRNNNNPNTNNKPTLLPYHFHRQWTHGLIDNIIYLSLSIYCLKYSTWSYLAIFYFLGVFTHLIGDMLTGSIPWLGYGHYAKSMTRVGINRIVPSHFHDFFSKKLPKFFDWASIGLFILGFILFFYFKGFEKLIQPLFSNLF